MLMRHPSSRKAGRRASLSLGLLGMLTSSAPKDEHHEIVLLASIRTIKVDPEQAFRGINQETVVENYKTHSIMYKELDTCIYMINMSSCEHRCAISSQM